MRSSQMKTRAISVVKASSNLADSTKRRQHQVTVLLNNEPIKVKFSCERDGERFGVEVSQRIGNTRQIARQHYSIVHTRSPNGQPLWTVPGVALRVRNPKSGWLAIARHLVATTLTPNTSPEDLYQVGDRVHCFYRGRKEEGELVDIDRDTMTATVWVDFEYLHSKKDAGLRVVPMSQINSG